MVPALRLGLAGVGTVGSGLLELLSSQHDLIEQRTGRRVVVTTVMVRNTSKSRAVDLTRFSVVPDAAQLATHNDVDVVVELMGGSDDPALLLVQTALHKKKPVVTANKALMAKHGGMLSDLARAHQTPLLFEAAVGGSLPVIKLLREALAANRITSFAGILNGTCNYILSSMERDGADFDTVLKDAQAKGYAEADPSTDIDGFDTAHKLAICVSIITGRAPDLKAVKISGIRDVTLDKIHRAKDKGFRIKLLGIYDGVSASVEPSLVPHNHPLAAIDGPMNGVIYTGDAAGTAWLAGRGAGGRATASAVLADIMDLMTGRGLKTFGLGPFITNDPPLAKTEKPLFDPDLGLRIIA